MGTVRLSDLKARLREHLRRVRHGRTLIVVDRGQAIARIVPYDGEHQPLTIRSPRVGAPALAHVSLPRPLRAKIDVTDLLAKERQRER